MKRTFLRAPSLLRWGAFVLLASGVLPVWAEQEKPEMVLQIGRSDGVLLAPVAKPSDAEWSAVRLETAHGVQTSGNTIQWRDLKSGAVLRTVPLASWPIWEATRSSLVNTALSPDGKIVASAGYDGVTRLQESWTGRVVRELPGEFGPLLFSPDGKLLVTRRMKIEDGRLISQSVNLWDAQSGKPLHSLPLKTQSVAQSVFSPDANTLATYGMSANPIDSPSHVQFWNAKSGDLIATSVAFSNGRIRAARFLPDGKRFVLVNQRTGPDLDSSWPSQILEVCIWNRTDGRLLHFFKHSYASLQEASIAFTADGKLLTSAGTRVYIRKDPKDYSNSEVRVTHVWDLPNGAPPRAPTAKELPASKLWSNAYKPTHFPPAPKAILASLRPINASLFLPGKDAPTTFDLWKVLPTVLRDALQGQFNGANAFDISPDGKYLAQGGAGGYGGSGGAGLKLWNIGTGKELWNIGVKQDHSNGIAYAELGSLWATDLLFSPDSKTVAVSSSFDQKPITAYDARNGRVLWSWPPAESPRRAGVHSLAFSRDGKILAASGSFEKSGVALFDAQSGLMLRTFGDSQAVRSLAFSPDGNVLACGVTLEDKTRGGFAQRGEIQLWDTQTGELLRVLKGHDDEIKTLSFSPDGKTLVSGGRDITLRLWNVADGSLAQTMRGHAGAIINATFNANGKVLMTVEEEGGVKFWSVATGKPIATLTLLSPPQQQATAQVEQANRKTDATRKAVQVEWLLFTPEGFYQSSPGAEKWIRWRVGNQLFPAQKFKARFYQPARVQAALRD